MKKIFNKIIRRLYRGRLMSVRSAIFWRKFGRIFTGVESPLLPDTDDFNFSTYNIKNKEISNALSSTKLTRWSLDVDSINWLIDYITENNINRVIEFGSGTSSLVFANLCSDKNNDDICVVSIDQDESYAEQSRMLIEANGFENNVEIIHCPLAERNHELGKIIGYDVTKDTFKEIPQGWKAGLLFVDGPATDGWGRLPAIVDSMDYLADDCILIMDDALRDDELKIVSYLNKGNDWKFEGIAAVSKGIAVARRKKICE